MYGFELIETLSEANLEVKEGTLYPLMNRMNAEGLLSAVWETDTLKGHPRKFYSLTRQGQNAIQDMSDEFDDMIRIYRRLAKGREEDK